MRRRRCPCRERAASAASCNAPEGPRMQGGVAVLQQVQRLVLRRLCSKGRLSGRRRPLRPRSFNFVLRHSINGTGNVFRAARKCARRVSRRARGSLRAPRGHQGGRGLQSDLQGPRTPQRI